MSRRHSSLFLHVKSQPNPDVNPALWEHRLRQRRPISRNPFEKLEESAPSTDFGLPVVGSPPAIHDEPFDFDKKRSNSKTDEVSKEDVNKEDVNKEDVNKEEVKKARKNFDVEWGEQIPSWLNLFYDLAWTATFSSLTSNNRFREPWDSVSYIAFFTAAWWLWVSQVFYNIDFYTDDWFHLLFIFLQLIVFGALAATTRGFDVTNYITHSPGSPELETYDIMTITPARYGAERLTKISFMVIMLVLALSRVLLLVQHLRVLIYAGFTSKSRRFPYQLFIVPAALIISTGLCMGALAISLTQLGREPFRAKIKYGMWGIALFIEIVAHIIRFQMDIDRGVRLRSHGSITGRLCDITTIILGEGINAIAGTFYAVEQAPGFSAPTAAETVCCGVIVFFLAYLYFEGAAPLKSVRRRAAWVMMHLPWLLSVILLLEGVKNQLLLSSFLGSTNYLSGDIANAWKAGLDHVQFNDTMRPLLLQAGLSFDEQYGNLNDMIMSNLSTTPNITNEAAAAIEAEIQAVWYLRVQLLGTLNTYRTFMDNDSIPDATFSTIQKYLTDYNFTLEDVVDEQSGSKTQIPHFAQLLEDLVGSSVDNARYIMAMSGTTFIFLATLNLIQAWPRDRFHWASIFSRYAMGISLLLLLLLNLGKYQTFNLTADQSPSHQAGVYKWIGASWVLRTLALAYCLQFIIDTILVYLAVWFSKKPAVQTEEPEKRV